MSEINFASAFREFFGQAMFSVVLSEMRSGNAETDTVYPPAWNGSKKLSAARCQWGRDVVTAEKLRTTAAAPDIGHSSIGPKRCVLKYRILALEMPVKVYILYSERHDKLVFFLNNFSYFWRTKASLWQEKRTVMLNNEDFPGIVERTRADLLSIARRYGCTEPEEVYQLVCMKVWKHLKQFEKIGNKPGWLREVCRNCALDWHRQQRRHRNRGIARSNDCQSIRDASLV
ncbi:MAG TPA: sigma factor, partial [Pirellulales bacterium]|nr:sigma factor [Pirellulales bacterium]